MLAAAAYDEPMIRRLVDRIFGPSGADGDERLAEVALQQEQARRLRRKEADAQMVHQDLTNVGGKGIPRFGR